MNIAQAAKTSGLPPKTIRYYEDIGLLRPGRAENGYRVYSDRDVHKLAFLQRARGLGFSVEDCRQLLSLYEDQNRASADVKQLAQSRLNDIDTKLDELKSLRDSLAKLIVACRGDDRPDCPILEDLAATTGLGNGVEGD